MTHSFPKKYWDKWEGQIKRLLSLQLLSKLEQKDQYVNVESRGIDGKNGKSSYTFILFTTCFFPYFCLTGKPKHDSNYRNDVLDIGRPGGIMSNSDTHRLYFCASDASRMPFYELNSKPPAYRYSFQ